MRRRPLAAGILTAILGAAAVGAAPRAAAAVPGAPGCPILPADNILNTDISSLPVNPNSAPWLASMGGPGRMLHPDFGPSGDPSVPYGIPYTVVDGGHPKVTVAFDYASESDPGPYPFGPDTPIEGGAASTGDRHALMLESDTCTLYELYDAHYNSPGASTAGSGAVYDLRSDALRPAGWTSADAAGLPILPLLLRPDEVRAGSIRHAIRVTAASTGASFLWPARHQAGSANPALPPMGARFRLRAGLDISRFSPAAQVVLTAFRHYGLIVADNGSNWYFQGSADPSWDPALISELKTIPASDFEAVDESSLMADPNSGRVRAAPAATAPPPAATPRPVVRATPLPATAPPPPPSPSPPPVALALPPEPSPTPEPRPPVGSSPGASPAPPTAAPSSPQGLPPVPAAAALLLAAGAVLGRRWVKRRRNVPN
jgi:hypothetical protein